MLFPSFHFDYRIIKAVLSSHRIGFVFWFRSSFGCGGARENISSPFSGPGIKYGKRTNNSNNEDNNRQTFPNCTRLKQENKNNENS